MRSIKTHIVNPANDRLEQRQSERIVTDTLEILDPATTEVAEYRATEAGLVALRERLAGKTYDLTTTAGDAEARADRRELVTMRTGIERIRKDAKAPLLAQAKLLDNEAARITEAILEVENPIDDQIKADEQRRAAEKKAKAEAEARRAAAIEALFREMREIARQAAGKGSVVIKAKIDALEAFEIDERFGERYGEAEAECGALLGDLRDALLAAEDREEEARRLAAERQAIEAEKARMAAEEAQRQQRIAAEEAERRAKQQAEDDARAKAEAERQAVIRAQEEAEAAERARVEAERRAALRAEEDRLAALRAQAQAEHVAKMRAEREAAEAKARAEQEALDAERARLAAIAAEQEWEAAEKRRLAAEAERAREDAYSAAVDGAVKIVRDLAVATVNDLGLIEGLIDEARQVVEVLGND